MATPTIYTRTYSYTKQANTTFSAQSRTINKTAFAVSGNTTEPVGMITKIVFEHYHSATNSSSSAKSWSLYCNLIMGGTTFTSDTVTKSIHGSVVKYSNTFASNLPTRAQFEAWTQAQIVRANSRSDSDLYWRATTSQPIRIIFYFISARDLVDGNEDPPTVGSTIGVSDATIVSGTTSAKDYFGGIVQGKSDLTLTGTYTIDRSYEFISASHDLVITDSDGNTLYEATQQDDNVFHVGTLDASGNVTVTYTVTDNGGKDAEGTYTLSILEYSPPRFTVEPLVERYEVNIESQHVPAFDGEKIWLTLGAKVTNINASSTYKNSWNLICAYASEDGETSGTVTVYQYGQTGTAFSVSMNRNESTFGSYSFDASQKWTFEFTLTDIFGAVRSPTVSVDEAGAYFNVYPYGAAIGMRGNGTAGNKLFETAPDILTRLRGVNVYQTSEVKTGGLWIDGKPIYMRTLACSEAMSAGGSYYLPLGDGVSIDKLVRLGGFAYAADVVYPIPFVHTNNAYCIQATIQRDNTRGWYALLSLGGSRSGISGGAQLTVEYTKNE